MSTVPQAPEHAVRPSWRDRLVTRYARCPEHPCRLRLLGGLKQLLRVDKVQVEVVPGVVMELDESDFVQREIIFCGGYERRTLQRFDALLSRARGFVDVGAHVGQFTLRAARAFAGRGRVAAFEPMPRNAAQLMRNAALSGLDNIDLFSVALSDRDAVLRMDVPVGTNSGSARIAPAGGTTADMALCVAALPAAAFAERLPSHAFDLVKIDVEGHEVKVLESIFNSSFAPPSDIIVEYLPEVFDYGVAGGLPAWLEQRGYTVRTVDGDRLDQVPFAPESNLWASRRT